MGELLKRTGERARSLAVVAALLALTPSMAAAGNLIVNGGFETGDFTGWEYSPYGIGVKNLSAPLFKQTTPPRSGSYAAVLGGHGWIWQRSRVVLGEMYDLTFYVNSSLPDIHDTLSVEVGSNLQSFFKAYSGQGSNKDNGYQKEAFRFRADESNLKLTFTVTNACFVSRGYDRDLVCPINNVSPLYPFLVDDVSLELVKQDTQQVNFQGGPLPKIGGETQVDLPGQSGPQGAGGGGVPPIASPEPGTLGLMLAAGGAAMLFRSQRSR